MTLDEAIEILKGEPGPQFILEGRKAFLAAQLGIEALKRIEEARNPAGRDFLRPLPGETEE